MYYNSCTCLVILFFLISCTAEEESKKQRGRTVLFYMATDNNLSSEADEKMNALALGWMPEWGELLFYTDRSNEPPCLYRATGGGKVQVVQTYEEENSASAEVLSKVVSQVAARYPANSYGLIFFSHASGWLPQGALIAPRSIGLDKKNEMELSEFASALPDGMFDFILFEACLMGGIEVAYELKDKADYLLMSPAEIVSPGFTPIYGEAAGLLFEEQANLIGFARSYADYCDEQQGYLRSRTLTLIDTSCLDDLAHAMKELNMEVVDETPFVQSFDRTHGYHLYLDLADWVKVTGSEVQSREVERQMKRCVVWKDYSPEFMVGNNGFYINKYSGLTTYVMQRRFPVLNEAYKQTKWYREILNH